MQVTNTWIGVYEPYTADFLTERGIPCFDARSMLQLDPKSAPAHTSTRQKPDEMIS